MATAVAPNAETLAAIVEVEEMKRNPHLFKSFSSLEELFADLNDDSDDDWLDSGSSPE